MINPLEDFISLIFPRSCITCRRELFSGERHICFSCLDDLPYTHFESQKENPVEHSFAGRIEIRDAMSYLFFEKASKTQQIMYCLKYGNMPALGYHFGGLMGEALKNSTHFRELDGLIPVPLHPAKRRIRTYNQSEEIGKGISEILEIPLLTNALRRIVKTETQTRKKRYQRWENVNSVFKANPKELDGMQHILLVDDVLTTGATLEACASALKENGTFEVSMATLAYSD